MNIDFIWNYGAAIGFLIADKEAAEEDNIAWGIAIFLGPITLIVEKPNA